MKFSSLLSHWKLRDMVSHNETISLHRDKNSDNYHVTQYLIISNSNFEAHILYRYKSDMSGNISNISLIHSDIVFILPQKESKLFIEKAKLSDLMEYFT